MKTLLSLKISLKFVPKGPIRNIPALVQVMAWHRPGDKPLSDPMMIKFTDAYMRHSASMSQIKVNTPRTVRVMWLLMQLFPILIIHILVRSATKLRVTDKLSITGTPMASNK